MSLVAVCVRRAARPPGAPFAGRRRGHWEGPDPRRTYGRDHYDQSSPAGSGAGAAAARDQACLERELQVDRTHIRTPDMLGPAWPWPAFAASAIVRYPFGMPRADRVSLTAANLAMPPVDHLSNRGTLNVLLDRTMSGVPAGLPPDRTMVGLFMKFSRPTDKALREYDAARAELLLYISPPDEILRTSPYLRAIDHMENCISAFHRAVLNARALQASKIGTAGPRLTPLARGAPGSPAQRDRVLR